jgi:hypothetical protein
LFLKETLATWRFQIMRGPTFSLILLFAAAYTGSAQTNSPASPPATNAAASTARFDENADAATQVPILHQAWAAEHDPAKRRDLAAQLVQAVIHVYEHQPIDIADEVARNGLPRNEIAPPPTAMDAPLTPLVTLDAVHTNEGDYPPSPVFRRLSAHRIEAWTPREGWLFDAQGKLVADVHVPRRDGAGREWFGAFLPDGAWITTDLWNDDRQLNAYTPTAVWQWELPGTKIVAALPKPETSTNNEPVVPTIGWARADSTGRKWLVGVGLDYTRGFALVDPDGHVQPLPNDTSLWSMVYPRSMGVRGYYIHLYIDSDDGRTTLSQDSAGHGVEVGWPTYSLSRSWSAIINGGTDRFGFWPESHRIYVEAESRGPDPWHAPHEVWFLDANGKYEAEVTGSYLADAANGRDLLLKDAGDRVLRVVSGKNGVSISGARTFTWPDGSVAVPLAVYDDLHLGFFLRTPAPPAAPGPPPLQAPAAPPVPALTGFDDNSRSARTAADIVLAQWGNSAPPPPTPSHQR